LNRLANKYEILPEGVNCLSVEIVREFLTVGHLFFLEPGAKLLGILTQQKVKSTKKYKKSKFTLKKKYQSA